uniref:Uncharacterized protein n=2 Tax=Nothobranchius TaxID=28779 RepID=A0A1A8MU92_9TELE
MVGLQREAPPPGVSRIQRQEQHLLLTIPTGQYLNLWTRPLSQSPFYPSCLMSISTVTGNDSNDDLLPPHELTGNLVTVEITSMNRNEGAQMHVWRRVDLCPAFV